MKRNKGPLQAHAIELLSIFKRASSKYEAHQQSRNVLRAMAADPSCLRAALADAIQKPGGLNARHFPSIGLPIAHNAHFTLVANCFLPLPNGETDITTNSVHHHGHLLLTTVTTFGPGYRHWRFTSPKAVDPERDVFSLEVLDREQHGPNHVAFVDSLMPHAVMFPSSLTVTFALWSSRHEVTWRDHIKRLRALEARREWLEKIVRRFRLSAALGLNAEGYFDFYPVEDGFKGMRRRIQFQRGPNEDFLHTLFHILQQTGNENLAPDGRPVAGVPVENPRLIEQLGRDLRRGVPIACRFSEGLHWLDHMNFRVEQIEKSLAFLRAGPRSQVAAVMR
jgi:hypothetical protein